jgi:glycylpeptide N-tetradecanoyltransferase
MEAKDIDGVLDLLKRYLARFDMAPVFTREEVEHWLLHKKDELPEQVVWSYVVEVSQLSTIIANTNDFLGCSHPQNP